MGLVGQVVGTDEVAIVCGLLASVDVIPGLGHHGLLIRGELTLDTAQIVFCAVNELLGCGLRGVIFSCAHLSLSRIVRAAFLDHNPGRSRGSALGNLCGLFGLIGLLGRSVLWTLGLGRLCWGCGVGLLLLWSRILVVGLAGFRLLLEGDLGNDGWRRFNRGDVWLLF